MEFEELIFFYNMIRKEELKQERLLMRVAAFTTYVSGAGGDKSYEAYISSLGLSESKSKMNKNAKKVIAKKAHESAERILKMKFKKK